MSSGSGKLSDGSTLLTGITLKSYNYKSNSGWYSDKRTVERTWHEVQSTFNPEVLDTRTIGHNVFWKTYPRPWNPKTYSGKDDYSYIPSNPIEIPGYIHDRAYDNKEARGANSLFTNEDVIGDDWRFVAQELALSLDPNLDAISRYEAFFLGLGLELFAEPKTIYHYSKKILKAAGKGASAIKH